mmetsp:Transcript_14120/g.32867  ORF Transcript_14120/g.32867 Transcript_14120/m.32867 type:complete len:317 (-) Transcript_14120:636-1586(-)
MGVAPSPRRRPRGKPPPPGPQVPQQALGLLLLRPGVLDEPAAQQGGRVELSVGLVVLGEEQEGLRLDGFQDDPLDDRVERGSLLVALLVLGRGARHHVPQLQVSQVALRGFFLLAALPVEGRELLRGDPLVVLLGDRPFVGPNGVRDLVEGRKALADGAPHSRIVRPEGRRLSVVEQGVQVHVEELVGLAQAVPGPVILGRDRNGPPVGFHGLLGLLQLDVFVTHEGPGRRVGPIELEGPLEVQDGLLALLLEGVVVSHDAAGFGTVLVDDDGLVSKVGEAHPIFLHVKNVRVDVLVVEGVPVVFGRLAEPHQSLL